MEFEIWSEYPVIATGYLVPKTDNVTDHWRVRDRSYYKISLRLTSSQLTSFSTRRMHAPSAICFACVNFLYFKWTYQTKYLRIHRTDFHWNYTMW